VKNILVLIHDDSGQEARLQAALDVTRAVRGHLTCLDVTVLTPVVADPSGYSAGAALMVIERETEADNRSRILPRVEAEDVPHSWIDVVGYLDDAVIEAADLADLIVVNRRLDSFAMPDMRALATDLVLRSGKPVLAVPEHVERFDCAGAALVAWDGSREAAAALAGAVPLLALAGSVAIVEIDDGSVKQPAEDSAAYLSRHGIHANVVRLPACGSGAGEILLAEANGGRFGYVVMGGFGHSPLREALFGGVTRTLLTDSRIPLFLVH
jgi:nucleotide-binding universal stress UspA family protein